MNSPHLEMEEAGFEPRSSTHLPPYSLAFQALFVCFFPPAHTGEAMSSPPIPAGSDSDRSLHYCLLHSGSLTGF